MSTKKMTAQFAVEKVANAIVIKSLHGLLLVACEELSLTVDQVISTYKDKEFSCVVLDVNNNKEVSQGFVRAALLIKKKLRSVDKSFFIIKAPTSWERFVTDQGLSIPIFPDLGAVFAYLDPKGVPGAASPSKIDVNFVNPFIEAAVHTLKVQCSIDAVAGKPFLKGHGPEITIDIAGVIGLTSKGFIGTIAVAFPKTTFLAAMGNMLGEKYSEITKDLEDGAGELINIIFGQAKVKLNEQNYAIERALPTVVRGSDLAMTHYSSTATIVLPFETPVGPFHVQVNVDAKPVRF